MLLSKKLVYANTIALLVNGILVWLVVVRLFPAMLGIVLVMAFLLGSVWFSCRVNGLLPHKARNALLYSNETEPMETV